MEITKTLYVTHRDDWRKWLEEHHKTERDIWLIYYRKNADKPRLPYNDAVEEALCFGWIDSTIKPIDDQAFAQRFSPRRPRSELSPMNRERVKRLILAKKMTEAGMESIRHAFTEADLHEKTVMPDDLILELKKDKEVWKNFQQFPESYKRIRIGWVDGARQRPEVFKTRLNYFIKMTKKNKMYGMVQ
ncbi:MAG: YdeI/OmpD-associated family protein [Bacteroidia bacterium]